MRRIVERSPRHRALALVGALLLVVAAAGAGVVATTVAAPPADAGTAPLSAVSGNRLVDTSGRSIQLRGVNVQSTEYTCIQGNGVFFQLGTTAARAATLDAMESWGINAVRVPLNSDCWLGAATGKAFPAGAVVGAAYRDPIIAWVRQIQARGMVAIIDLHWSAPDGALAVGQAPMADLDTSVEFWASVANQFAEDNRVIYDLFNEPYLEREVAENPGAGDDIETLDQAWDCWVDGCTVQRYDSNQAPIPGSSYETAGMQDLIDAVRAHDNHPLLVGGLQYTQEFGQLAARMAQLDDPQNQLIASFHAYPGNTCGLDPNACRTALTQLAGQVPLLIGEFGRDDCTTTNVEGFLDAADAMGAGYVGWAWIAGTGQACGNNRYSLIEDFATGAPSTTGTAVRDHYLEQSLRDLQVDLTVTPTTVAAGGTVELRLRFTNPSGPIQVTGLTATPGGALGGATCALPLDLAATSGQGECVTTVAVSGTAGQQVPVSVAVTRRSPSGATFTSSTPARTVTIAGATTSSTSTSTTSTTVRSSTTSTTTPSSASSTSTTVRAAGSSTSTTTASAVLGAGGTSTTVAAAQLPRTGASIRLQVLVALALLGAGMVVAGSVEVTAPAVRRRTHR